MSKGTEVSLSRSLPIWSLMARRTSPSLYRHANTRPAPRPKREDLSRLALSGVLQIVLHFLHAELTNHCNACSSLLFSKSATHDCHDPISIIYPVTAGTLWCKNTQSHSNIISTGVQTAFHTDIPSRPANVITKKSFLPHSGGISGRQRASKRLLFLFCIGGFWILRARDVRRVRAGTSAR